MEPPNALSQSIALTVNLEVACWLFKGNLAPNGYGQMWANGVHWMTHRYMWTAMRGPIPEGMTIDHLCRVRRCVNPQHMELVTQKENNRRGDGWAGRHARKTHCVHGHEFTVANTYWYLRQGNHVRACRACMQRLDREHKERKRHARP